MAKETGFGEPIGANEEAATAVEYGLIALACIIAFTSLGLNLAGIFNTISNALSWVGNAPDGPLLPGQDEVEWNRFVRGRRRYG